MFCAKTRRHFAQREKPRGGGGKQSHLPIQHGEINIGALPHKSAQSQIGFDQRRYLAHGVARVTGPDVRERLGEGVDLAGRIWDAIERRVAEGRARR